jgi:hypothetical protein
MNMPAAAIAITAVASHPMIQRLFEIRVNCPIIRGLWIISIMTTMIGTATTPLTTAAQKSALIGVRWVCRWTTGKLIASPNSVATVSSFRTQTGEEASLRDFAGTVLLFADCGLHRHREATRLTHDVAGTHKKEKINSQDEVVCEDMNARSGHAL